MRVGVLGGTFDPIHLGHLALAEAAIECARLDLVLIVPAAVPPHRSPALAPAVDRVEMCRLAAASDPRLEVSEVEVGREGPSYTLDTLAELHRRRPGDRLFLILGWDAAREIPSWHKPEQVLGQAELVVVNRPGLQPPDADALRAAELEPERVTLCPQETPPVRATEIRRLAAEGASLAGKVPAAVADYIRKRGLYRS
jgi:nicotinate-nucleotide adenylyltransferase